MSEKLPENPERRFQLRDIPAKFTIREIVQLLVVTVMVASAFFMYDTRITVIESFHEQVQIQSNQEQKALDQRLRRAEAELLSIKTHLENDVNQHNDIQDIEGRVRELEYEIQLMQIQRKMTQ